MNLCHGLTSKGVLVSVLCAYIVVLQVVVAKEAVGNLGGMVRQLSLDQFENESRRMVPMNNELSYPTKKFTRQKSPQGLHKKVSVTEVNTIILVRTFAGLNYLFSLFRLYPLCFGLEIGKLLLIGGFSWILTKLGSYVMLQNSFSCMSQQFFS